MTMGTRKGILRFGPAGVVDMTGLPDYRRHADLGKYDPASPALDP
jgi:hypothetical protein